MIFESSHAPPTRGSSSYRSKDKSTVHATISTSPRTAWSTLAPKREKSTAKGEDGSVSGFARPSRSMPA